MLIKQEKFTPKIHSFLAFTPTQKVPKRESSLFLSPPSSEDEASPYLRSAIRTRSYMTKKQNGNGFKEKVKKKKGQ